MARMSTFVDSFYDLHLIAFMSKGSTDRTQARLSLYACSMVRAALRRDIRKCYRFMQPCARCKHLRTHAKANLHERRRVPCMCRIAPDSDFYLYKPHFPASQVSSQTQPAPVCVAWQAARQQQHVLLHISAPNNIWHLSSCYGRLDRALYRSMLCAMQQAF